MSEEKTWFNAVPYSHDWNAEDRTPIEGIYHGKISVDADHEQKFWVYLLRSERGFEKLEGRTQLDRAMEMIPLGSTVRVVNLGLESINGGMSERQFEVLLDIGEIRIGDLTLNTGKDEYLQDTLDQLGFNTAVLDDSP